MNFKKLNKHLLTNCSELDSLDQFPRILTDFLRVQNGISCWSLVCNVYDSLELTLTVETSAFI